MNKERVLRPREFKMPTTDKTAKTVFVVIFAIYALILIFPFFWILINSFKDGWSEFSKNSWALPNVWMFSNYAAVFSLQDESFNVATMFINSIILCLIIPTCGCLSTTLGAYVMAKYKFRGRAFIYVLFIIPMLVTIAGTTSSTVMLFDNLGFNNIPFVGIAFMACGGIGMNFLLVYAVFKSTSDSYMEAARIDGASDFRIFGEIMLPHAMGIIGTLWIIGFIGTWNDYATPKIFLSNYYTVATGIQKIELMVTQTASQEFFINNYPVYFAAIIISIIPVIVIFLIFQKKIMNLSLGGGIK